LLLQAGACTSVLLVKPKWQKQPEIRLIHLPAAQQVHSCWHAPAQRLPR
jgi:hypothetical protein